MIIRRWWLAAAFGLTASPVFAAPDVTQLLSAVLETPKTAYQGHVTVTHWFGRSTHSEEALVYFSPPNRYRWEFLDPDGATVNRIVRSDGDLEEVEDVRHHRRFLGEPVKNYQRLMGEDKEREVLLKNYDLSAAGAGNLAGRPCWILDIVPKVSDKHRQRVWIDQETGVALQTRRFRPRGVFTTLSRYVDFEPKKELSDELFSFDASSAVEHGLDPLAISRDEFKKEYGQNFDPPAELPAGFIFESANHFDVGKSQIWHLRYTDGLATLSLFLTHSPVQKPRGQVLGSPEEDVSGAGMPILTSFAKVLQWHRNGRYYTLMGDVDRKWLQTIAAVIP